MTLDDICVRGAPSDRAPGGAAENEPSSRENRPTAASTPSRARARVIFLNRFFFPDHSATSQILSDLAFHLAGCGIDVRVVTSRQRYDDPAADLPAAEWVAGVRIDRVATTRFGRSALIGRGFDYLSFYRSAQRSIAAWARPGDVLVAKTDPPLLGVAVMRTAARRGLHLVNWLQDLYPEIATALRVPLVGGPPGRALGRLRDASLRAAAANVVVGQGMAGTVRRRGIPEARIRIVPNWCDDEAIRPVAPEHNPLRRDWGLCDRFVVGYSGNLGRGHEFGTFLEAAQRLRDDPGFCFLFIGGGNKSPELADAVRARELRHLFCFRPYQDRKLLGLSLSVADVHLVSLKPELEGLMVPSKLYGIAAAARPIIAVTARDGEIARLVERYRCGVVVEPGNAALLADTLRELCADRGRVREMGRRARAMLDARFTRRHGLERWRNLVEQLVSSPQRTAR